MVGGCDCRRFNDDGDVERDVLEKADEESAHSDDGVAKNVPDDVQELLGREAGTSAPGGGVVVMGLADGDGVLAITERGGSIVNIWSSA